MPPSKLALAVQVIKGVLNAVYERIFSRDWTDWDLRSHIQFEIFGALSRASLRWTVEDVPPANPRC